MKTMLFNPYTGKPRDPRDIASDPTGKLMLDPDEPVVAVRRTQACTAGRASYHFDSGVYGHPCLCEQCVPCQCSSCADSAIADLIAAVAFTDRMRAAASEGDEVAATGVSRDAREWLERAARRVTKQQGSASADVPRKMGY